MEAMIGADAALAALINRAATTYLTAAPAYITFQESTHVEGANKSEDINRYVAVRVADDYAVMRDLPQGAQREGPAFPVIPDVPMPITIAISERIASGSKVRLRARPITASANGKIAAIASAVPGRVPVRSSTCTVISGSATLTMRLRYSGPKRGAK